MMLVSPRMKSELGPAPCCPGLMPLLPLAPLPPMIAEQSLQQQHNHGEDDETPADEADARNEDPF